DADFDSWQANFLAYATANQAALDITAPEIAALNTAQTNWSGEYADHVTAQAAAISAKELKDLRRFEYEQLIRPIAQRVQVRPISTDAQRAGLGITVLDTTRTPVGLPTTRPVGNVDTSQRLRHIVGFADEGTPTKKTKPPGVHGCEIWVLVGPVPPTGLNQCTLLAVDTKTPYLAEYEPGQGNQTAHYILRWVNTKGQPGPISETISATIPA
ncbi:MAG: hypothetical protein ACREB3_06270, partial [Burkholderiales bacterium]